VEHPPVAVLLANMNWNAYNNWGGRSNYIHPAELPPRPGVNSRFDLDRYTKMDAYMHFDAKEYAPLSFERPEPLNHVSKETQVGDPLEGRSECHVAPAEWRLLGWLEREGIEYDTFAETQLHFGDLVLDDYKILVISAHPEYWSHEMYFKLKAWVFERGGKLMYLGGNGLNCEVTFSEDGTAMTCCNGDRGGGASELKRTTARADGSAAPTGLESRFDYYFESEANLLGVRCTETGIMTSAPYRAVLPDHWVFAGTGLAQGEAFGEECLHMRCPGGASGHETDKMSPSSPPGTVLLARGTNDGAPTEPGQETGGAEMVLHETDSGGAVFSVGSITYPCSLLVDTNISKVTLNVVRKFLG
jgi:N,N-dimethylformamidase